MNHIINNFLIALNGVGKAFCGYSASVFVQSALLVVAILVIDLLLRKRVRAIFRYCLWLLVLVKLILPPSLSLPTGIGYWAADQLPVVSTSAFDVVGPERMGASGRAPHVPSSEDSTANAPLVTPANSRAAPITWQAVLFVLWLVAVLAFLVVLAQRLKFVRGLVAASRPAEGESVDLLQQCRRQLGVRRNAELRLSDTLRSPAVCGLFETTILIPANLVEKLSPEGLRATLIHELAHIKRGDLWVNLAQTFLQVVYFYNPFVWFANSIIRKVCEEAVDETVLVALGGKAKDYSSTLIDIGEMVLWKADLGLRLIGVAESKKALQWRIRHMLARPIPKSSKLGIVGAIVIFAFAAVLLPMARAQKTVEKNEPVSGDNQEEYTKPLHQAAADGDIEQVKLLLSRGTDVNEKDQYGRTALHCASWKGHADVAELLINQGARINVTTAMMASSPLHFAVMRGDRQIVELLLSKGGNINAKNRNGSTPLFEAMKSTAADSKEVAELLVAKGAKVPALHLAAYMGDMEKLKQCLQDGIDINSQKDFGCTALHAAANGSKKDVVEFLISKGATVDAKGAYYDLTPLYYAALHNYQDIAELLLAKGANVNAKDKDQGGFSLLNHAIWDHSKDAVKLLINKGANVNAKDNTDGWPPLFYAVWENDKDIAELLISKGADVKAEAQGLTPLDLAAREGRKELVELLTPKGAAPVPTIHLAAREGDLEKVKSLIEEGAEINAKKGGETPLFAALDAGKSDVAKFLIAQGADVNAPGFGGLTPLFPACVDGEKEVIELLISKGADVNAKAKGVAIRGLTPLHAACRSGRRDVAGLLIDKGADLNAKITFTFLPMLGWTPLHLGSSLGHKDVVELLIAKGADIHIQNSNSRTPLHEACSTGQKDVVELLIGRGADINAKDSTGQTALSLAKEKGHTEIVELLQKHGVKE